MRARCWNKGEGRGVYYGLEYTPTIPWWDPELGGGPSRRVGKIRPHTSPHLVTVRERIQINGSPISGSLFTRYFFELWDRFSDITANSSTPNPNPQSSDTEPGYFRYSTLFPFHTFINKGIQTATVECGIRGEYDSPNILSADAVTVSAITRLGIDHTGMLRETIEKITWHKSRTMKVACKLWRSSRFLKYKRF
jgi:folylpolyglutamate synthase